MSNEHSLPFNASYTGQSMQDQGTSSLQQQESTTRGVAGNGATGGTGEATDTATSQAAFHDGHPMRTCLRNNVRQPKVRTNGTVAYPIDCRCAMTTSATEPADHTEALKDPRWKEAMNDEYNALHINNTWCLVPPHQQNIIDSRWVFKLKRMADGSVER